MNVKAAEVPILARLRDALAAGDGVSQALLAELGFAPAAARELRSQALRVLQRAQARVPHASATELELALGALLALNMPAGPRQGVR